MYRSMLLRKAPDVLILRFAILRHHLMALPLFDVDAQPDPEAWMRKYSRL